MSRALTQEGRTLCIEQVIRLQKRKREMVKEIDKEIARIELMIRAGLVPQMLPK